MPGTNQLQHKQDFIDILHDYRISKHGQRILAKTKLVILVGLSASGRNTLISELVKRGGYHFIISDTTRAPKVRNGQLEEEGLQYFFRDEADILSDLKKGEYLEAELIHGEQVYGISIREIERASKSSEVAINDVDLGGAISILRAKPDTIALFVLPPSFKEWQRRLHEREDMDVVEYQSRMRTARNNILRATGEPLFHFLINDNLSEAVNEIDQLVHGKSVVNQRQDIGRIIAHNLLVELDNYLG